MKNAPSLRPAQDIEDALLKMLACEEMIGIVHGRNKRYVIDASQWNLGMLTIECLDDCLCSEWKTQVSYSRADTVILILQRAAINCGTVVQKG